MTACYHLRTDPARGLASTGHSMLMREGHNSNYMLHVRPSRPRSEKRDIETSSVLRLIMSLGCSLNIKMAYTFTGQYIILYSRTIRSTCTIVRFLSCANKCAYLDRDFLYHNPRLLTIYRRQLQLGRHSFLRQQVHLAMQPE